MHHHTKSSKLNQENFLSPLIIALNKPCHPLITIRKIYKYHTAKIVRFVKKINRLQKAMQNKKYDASY